MSFVFLYSNYFGFSFLSDEVLLSLSLVWQYFYSGVGKLFFIGPDRKYFRLCESYTVLQLLNSAE